MIWDARKLGDRAYHRRRAVLGLVVALIWLVLIIINADGISGHSASDILLVGIQVALVGYFVRMSVKEWIEMRRHV